MVSSEETSETQNEALALPQRRKLPAWLDHFNVHDLKIFLRCWIALWVTLLVIFIHPSLVELGQATFLGAILLFAVPPASMFFIYLLAAFSLLLGMCLAWCWGLLTMKAALATRSSTETQARFELLEQTAQEIAGQTGQSPAWEGQILIHEGFMLDTRVTVVFFAMGCIFIYAVARMRCSNPKLVVFQTFGTIVTDIFLLFGPGLPRFQGDLASILVKPGATGIGLGVACSLLLFPKSTSYTVLTEIEKLIRMSNKALAVTKNGLAGESNPLSDLQASRAGMIGVFKAGQPSLAFLPLDFSRGWWNANDIKGLHERARKLMFTSLYLLDFQIAHVRGQQKVEAHNKAKGDGHLQPTTNGEKHELNKRCRQENDRLLSAFQRPEGAALRSRTRNTLRETTSDLLEIAPQAVNLGADYIRAVNSCRWFGKTSPSHFEELNNNLHDLLARSRQAREACVLNTTKGVLQAHAELFDANGRLKPIEGTGPPFLPSMVIAMVIEERILNMAIAVEKLLEYILNLSEKRTTRRVWFPSRLQYAISWVFHGRVTFPGYDVSAEEDPDKLMDTETFDEQTKETRRRLEISRGYKGASARRNKLSRFIIATYNWLVNPAGMYAMRMVIVTIALSIPAVIPQTAGFFYREKGIWAVISAQTVLLVYLADFTFSLIARTVGTLVGGVIGMITWYIGAGSGIGNPYGMAAASGVMIIPLLWWRLYLPPAFAFATIMAGATFCLVVGFSWDHDHIVQYGLPGKGYEAFWKRVVTVLIGFLAAFIVQLFPSPPSGTTHVCKTLANSVRSLSDHYALLISHWGRTDKNSALGAIAENISIEVAEVLLALNPSIAMLKGELSFGPFDQKALQQTKEQCQYMNQALGGLLNLASTLPRELQDRLVHVAGILDERNIGDIMAVLGIIEQALRTGSPLPERLPGPLVQRAINAIHNQSDEVILTTELVQDKDHRRYCVAVILYFKFLGSIDDLLMVLKAALGERHVIYQWEDVKNIA
ncbi:related to membrane protein [Fusarium torulosum]|uniref:Related to membrane protein n=1 Tax=Fusarium torulosum TaxID=33205 RepID=A0AAE8M7V1_9HYPO|nr:related to membrane protein [Fusarium torulosum]